MRLLHTMLRVGDLDRSIAFYTQALGMRLLRRTERPEQKYSLAFIGYGSNPDHAEIELTYNHGVSQYEMGTAYGHVALGVPDVAAACEALRAKAAALGGAITREPGPVKGGTTVIAFITDPDGYRIELIERREAAAPGAAGATSAVTAPAPANASGREPATHAGPVRRFLDPQYQPLAATLGELRERIDALDAQIVALLAQRAACVRDATRFKAHAHQVAAPARQAQVFARVRALAQVQAQPQGAAAGFPGLPDIVEAAYRPLVAGFIAAEGQLFAQTERIDE